MKKSPRHPRVLKLLEKVYVAVSRMEKFTSLIACYVESKNADIVKNIVLLKKNIYCEIFRSCADKRLSDVRLIWEKVPRYLKKNPEVVCAYVRQLAPHVPVTGIETNKEIAELIRKAPKTEWNADLAIIYGSLSFAQSEPPIM